MYDRIKELADRANIKITPMVIDGEEYEYEEVEMDGSEDLQKFAELIVNECCSAIRLNDVFFGGKFQGAILKHFGINDE